VSAIARFDRTNPKTCRAGSIAVLALYCIGFALSGNSAMSQTLTRVKERGSVLCGVSQGLPGFSNPDSNGRWTGIDVDLCRGLAAAIFNDPGKVKFLGLAAKDRFTALQVGEIDVLSHDTTWTLSRDASLGLNFTGTTYYDGQGFMVRRSLHVTSARDLNGASVCTQTGTTTELNLSDFFKEHRMKYEIVTFESPDETVRAYESGRCDAFTNDISSLYAQKLKLEKPDDHLILDDVISKEPLGPAVRQGDDQWFDIVKWTLYAMIEAEELGISSKNIDSFAQSDRPDVKRFLGLGGDYGQRMGLSNEWAARIVRLVGNYGEIFERNVGLESKLGIPRGLNRLWSRGGIQYSPPIR
jgi:general L-amino acid transport system substrate-binding protein